MRIFVVGAEAVSVCGVGRAALASHPVLRTGTLLPSRQLARTHPGVGAAEVPEIPEEAELFSPRATARMSRASQLASIAVKRALREADFRDARHEIGCFLGVGGSGGSVGEVEAMLSTSVTEGALSYRLLGNVGLSACNPLLTFQTLHNFTLCHPTIAEGLGGPNGAFFSRGAGTLVALEEAAASIREGDCTRALAGGADTALHPVTWAELARTGYAENGLIPGEGAGVLALTSSGEGALAELESVAIHRARGKTLERVTTRALHEVAAGAPALPDHVVIAPWGDASRACLRACVEARLQRVAMTDASRIFGESLAASPALAWVLGVDLLVRGAATRVLVLSHGIDEELGWVQLSRGGAR
jgi:3-oxoacyl-(acyl-carrier-protein) synthase